MSNKFNILVKNIQGKPLKLKIIPTIFCYIFLVSSLYYFIISKNGSLFDAFILGFLIYGVYETTNLAIFNNWNLTVSIIDILWGGILFSSTIYLHRLAMNN